MEVSFNENRCRENRFYPSELFVYENRYLLYEVQSAHVVRVLSMKCNRPLLYMYFTVSVHVVCVPGRIQY